MPRISRLAFVLPALLAVAPSVARANDRHFTYTYESAVLPPGAKELELWVTPRLGRDTFYSRFDNRLEFEVGLTNRLQTSIYLNLNSITAADPTGARQTETEFAGVSSEWKYKVSDPVADALGFALYGEVTAATSELELETKLIFDKRVGPWLFGGNFVAEHEMEFQPGETEHELAVELDLGVSYFVGENWTFGLEVRNTNAFPGYEEWEHSALFAGPVLAYYTQSWWLALTVLPQLPALKKEGPGMRVLDEHEKFNARLLLSFHL
jgi:hypothetical protein